MNEPNLERPFPTSTAPDEVLEGEIFEGDILESERSYMRSQHVKALRLVELLSGPTPVTWAVIAVIFIVYGVFLRLNAGLEGEFSADPTFALYGGANWRSIMVAEDQWWRLLSSMFLHASVIHILFNAYALYALGPTLERLVGSSRYWLIILFSGLAGSAASFAVNGSPSVGISGAVFGLVGGLFMVSRKYREFFPDDFSARLRSGMIQILLINLALGFFVPRIDNSAHIGGLLGGALMTFLMASRLNETEDRRFWAKALALVSLAASIFFVTPVKGEIDRCLRSFDKFNTCYEPYVMQMLAAEEPPPTSSQEPAP